MNALLFNDHYSLRITHYDGDRMDATIHSAKVIHNLTIRLSCL